MWTAAFPAIGPLRQQMGGCPQNMMGGQFVALPGALFHGGLGDARSSGCLVCRGTLRILLLHQPAVSTNARLCEFTCVMSQIGIPNWQAKMR